MTTLGTIAGSMLTTRKRIIEKYLGDEISDQEFLKQMAEWRASAKILTDSLPEKFAPRSAGEAPNGE